MCTDTDFFLKFFVRYYFFLHGFGSFSPEIVMMCKNIDVVLRFFLGGVIMKTLLIIFHSLERFILTIFIMCVSFLAEGFLHEKILY
jgi:hypothetical protein